MRDYRRKLPHWQPDDVPFFVTWRLSGTLPLEKQVTASGCSPGQAFAAADRVLDQASTGPMWLLDPRIANIAVETLLAGDTERHFFELFAWVVMPNHVHLLARPRIPVPVLMRWLKGSTARRANLRLGRTGKSFWQDESYDHWVRSQREFDRISAYIEHNPVKAGLIMSPDLWPWSSATRKPSENLLAGETACPT
jgi:REP element-mobilizing transposase RayT